MLLLSEVTPSIDGNAELNANPVPEANNQLLKSRELRIYPTRICHIDLTHEQDLGSLP